MCLQTNKISQLKLIQEIITHNCTSGEMTCESILVLRWVFSIASFSTIVFNSLIVSSELFSCFFKCSTSNGLTFVLWTGDCCWWWLVGVGGLADITEFVLLEVFFVQVKIVLVNRVATFNYFISNKIRHNYHQPHRITDLATIFMNCTMRKQRSNHMLIKLNYIYFMYTWSCKQFGKDFVQENLHNHRNWRLDRQTWNINYYEMHIIRLIELMISSGSH